MRRLWILLILPILLVGWWGVSHVKITNKLIWVSCPPMYRLRVDQEKIRELLPAREQAGIVYLACELVKTSGGVGSGNFSPFLYANQDTWLGIPRVQLYLDVPVAELYPEGERGQLTSLLIVGQLARLEGMGEKEAKALEGKAYYAETPIVSIVGVRSEEEQ